MRDDWAYRKYRPEYSFDYFNFIDYVPYLSTLVENASHIRLREIYLGYDLPKHICDVLHVRGCPGVFASAEFRFDLGC